MTAYKGKSRKNVKKSKRSQTRKQRGGIGSIFRGRVNGIKISEKDKAKSLAKSYKAGTELISKFMDILASDENLANLTSGQSAIEPNSGALLKMKSGLALKLDETGNSFQVIGVFSRQNYTQMEPSDQKDALVNMLNKFGYKDQALKMERATFGLAGVTEKGKQMLSSVKDRMSSAKDSMTSMMPGKKSEPEPEPTKKRFGFF